jgi:hypothetical protein
MQLTVYLPDTSGLLETPVSCPALERMLAAGRHVFVNEPLHIMMCREFGMEAQPGDWPLAALSWLGEGNDPAEDCWLQADPIYLALQRDYFTLYPRVPVPLQPDEAEALVGDLNRHFAADGLQFILGCQQGKHAGMCYLRLKNAPALRTSLPEYALGGDIRAFMPQGADASRWHRLINEIQMLLHEHPVNQVREGRGELPVNSLWFSACGVRPANVQAAERRVFSDYPLMTGLARTAGLERHALPADARAMFKQTGEHVVVALSQLEQADQQWFAPLLNALASRTARRIDLHFAVRGQVLSVRVHWYDLLRWWRRPKPVSVYLNS